MNKAIAITGIVGGLLYLLGGIPSAANKINDNDRGTQAVGLILLAIAGILLCVVV